MEADTMPDNTFRALVARRQGDAQAVAVESLSDADLPAADVTIDVEYSSFNYKDGLALAGRSRILRTFPIIPGIDYAGTVASSASDRFAPGERVVLTGWGVGENWSGGFAERARAKAEWLVKLPEALSTRQAMAIGTAGLTAMLCVMGLEKHGIRPGGDVLVTGAAGGVGSVAVRLLSRLGYKVTALTGRLAEADFLRALGAAAIMDRAEYAASGKPLAGERWAAAVDTVGGTILANVLAATAYDGAVAACGLAGGTDLPASVFPFILRGVALLGIDSVMCPLPRREAAWRRLAAELQPDDFTRITTMVGLEDLPALAEKILAGQVRGRTVVRVRGAT
jgi:acrylyl-CoA reductase (NADPH)